MLTPFRSALRVSESSDSDSVPNNVLTLQSAEQRVTVSHDGFTIGASSQCDLSVNDETIPMLHSIIHVQNGAVWIEAADESAKVTVNDRPYKRMALRHDDRLLIGSTEFKFLVASETIAKTDSQPLKEDLTLLTAEELCDRILSEQAMVSDFISGQRSGWEALLRAIEEVDVDSERHESQTDEVVVSNEEQIALNSLLQQIQELNETIVDRTRELGDREKEVLESNSKLEESQQQVTQRIEELLDQLNLNDSSNDLRASA